MASNFLIMDLEGFLQFYKRCDDCGKIMNVDRIYGVDMAEIIAAAAAANYGFRGHGFCHGEVAIPGLPAWQCYVCSGAVPTCGDPRRWTFDVLDERTMDLRTRHQIQCKLYVASAVTLNYQMKKHKGAEEFIAPYELVKALWAAQTANSRAEGYRADQGAEYMNDIIAANRAVREPGANLQYALELCNGRRMFKPIPTERMFRSTFYIPGQKYEMWKVLEANDPRPHAKALFAAVFHGKRTASGFRDFATGEKVPPIAWLTNSTATRSIRSLLVRCLVPEKEARYTLKVFASFFKETDKVPYVVMKAPDLSHPSAVAVVVSSGGPTQQKRKAGGKDEEEAKRVKDA